jgi:oxepin-CoA hydrolase/3-oxo-5,6-dehydrosuberyl-CoA semialdehyde dehydrogenase
MDEEAAKASPIFEGQGGPRLPHPELRGRPVRLARPGPVLANTASKSALPDPLYPGDSLRVELTVRAKSIKSEETGQVRWAVEVFNQKDELVATYDLLTENIP